jgi:uncharacterized protein (DUF1501 family)
MHFTRREFLKTSSASAGLYFFGATPLSAFDIAAGPSLGNDRILVLLVPHGLDEYGQSRSRTRIPASEVLRIDNRCGLHPELSGMKELYDKGRLAIVQGVGYPDPDRSHFKSMDIWHAADRRGRLAGDGWVGRLADTAFAGSDDPNLVVHIGHEVPFSLTANVHRPVAFTAPEAYRWIGARSEAEVLERSAPLCEHEEAPSRRRGATEFTGRDGALERLRKTLHEAQSSSEQVRKAAARYTPRAKYPATALAGSLATVAALISGGLSTRIYSVQTGGFDTHVNQKPTHDRLMRDLGDSLRAFLADLEAQGALDRVVVLAFSEFGRRVHENGSGGTDHGVAGPLFVLGGRVKGGLHGRHPSLTDLDNGDLIHTTDFRHVYASLIDDWMGARHQEILGGKWPGLELVRG